MRNITKKKNLFFKINNRQRKIRIDISNIQNILDDNINLFFAPPEEIGVIIVSDRAIKTLNKKFLNKDSTTDVLSFKLSKKYGEIIISSETTYKNSLLYGVSLEEELIYLIIHGYLHLKNYKDYTSADRKKMLSVQDEIFSSIFKGDIK